MIINEEEKEILIEALRYRIYAYHNQARNIYFPKDRVEKNRQKCVELTDILGKVINTDV